MALKKNPNPTFKHEVEIPVPGEKPEKVEFVFKHKGKKAYQQFVADCMGRDDVESALEIVVGWNIDDEFGPVSKDSLETLYETSPGAPTAIYIGYSKGLHQGRLGN